MFLMMYSAYKLNKQDYNIHPWHTPFPTWNQSVPCPVLTVASWPACRFLLDILFTRYAKWNSAYPVVYWKAFDGWDELFLESSHVLCFANETSTMVNNWYSILYSLANGLKPEATGHEHPTKNIILRSITWGSLSCTSFFLTSKTRCYATTFWIILFPELFGEKKKKNLFQKFKHYQLQWMTVHSCFLSPLGTRFSGGHAITHRLASKFCWGCCDLLAGMTQMKPPFKKMTQCYLKDSVM